MITDKLIIDTAYGKRLECFINEYGNKEIKIVDNGKELYFLMTDEMVEKLIIKLNKLLSQKQYSRCSR